MADKERIHHAILATVATLGLLGAACGTAAMPDGSDAGLTERRQQVIQDPDNPAARSYAAQHSATNGVEASTARVIRDPDNPAAAAFVAPALREVSEGGLRVIRDPDDPHWSGR